MPWITESRGVCYPKGLTAFQCLQFWSSAAGASHWQVFSYATGGDEVMTEHADDAVLKDKHAVKTTISIALCMATLLSLTPPLIIPIFFINFTRCKQYSVVELLIEKDPEYTYGANVSGGTPLYMAAERGFTIIVQIILDKSHKTRTSPAYSGFMGRTALHAAVLCNYEEMTKAILEWNPALTKEVDEKGWSPLHCAAERNCNPTIVRQLLEKSDKSIAYLGIKDGNKTALHIASLHHHKNIIEELLSHYPDCCEQVDNDGHNVFHFSMMKKGDHGYKPSDYFGNEWLRARGLVNEKDGQGNTPIHLLSSYQISDFQFLYGCNVDMKAYNSENLTAYDIISRAKKDISKKKDMIQGAFEMVMPETKSSFWETETKKWEKYLTVYEGIEEDIFGENFQEIIKKLKTENESKEDKEKRTSALQKQGETHLIVSALITTVTFAAGFTLPGGYDGDDGKAILSKKAAFGAFVVTDTIAMLSSLCAVFLHFFMTMRNGEEFLAKHLVWAFILTMIGMGAMAIAFATGLYAVLPHSSGLSVLTCILCSCFFLSFILEYFQNWRGMISGMVRRIRSWLRMVISCFLDLFDFWVIGTIREWWSGLKEKIMHMCR